ncbi:phospholipase A [Sulfurospirillum diekertiae]|uniref:Phosphatidylcholine 1-acylhydrolase n=1 Tax=Sulfurospirillum diekertiae TaxID=1854492 RepID=A0A290HTA1_9BACT|nr:phospholipase A [Sulfurospirillum diekertiae]ATB70928.1 putative phospholipase A [Sulfurospirillum diekertiae]QIR75993.1 phospholipase A [Sulfurospirillum diekertiae]QIR78636.1 phospholipase A [Sulfurospirillum diekertiae]
MKKILLCAIVAQIPWALLASDTSVLEEKATHGDAHAAYELAKYYEAQHESDRSLLWYKQAAILSLETKTTQNKALESGLTEQLQKIERKETVYSSFLTPYKDDEETKNSVQQMVTQSFDIAPYKMNYLLPITYDAVSHDNRDHQETKFQVSFQKGLSDNLLGLHESFVVAYTQTSWWQTAAESAPFRETNYQPELFMIMPHFDQDSFIKAYQFGILHESNGQGGEKSRSWNRLYAKTFLQAGGLVIAPRIWYRIPENSATDDNPNIEDYLGYADLELTYPWKAQTFKLLIRNNLRSENNKGAVQGDWTFPLWEKDLFGYVQLYSGYAESLIDYDKRSNRIGLGFALSR